MPVTPALLLMLLLPLAGMAWEKDAKRDTARSDSPGMPSDVVNVLTALSNCRAPLASFIASSCRRMASGLSPIRSARAASTTFSGFSCTGWCSAVSKDVRCGCCAAAPSKAATAAAAAAADLPPMPVGSELILRTGGEDMLFAAVSCELRLLLFVLLYCCLLRLTALSVSSSAEVCTALGGSNSRKSLHDTAAHNQG